MGHEATNMFLDVSHYMYKQEYNCICLSYHVPNQINLHNFTLVVIWGIIWYPFKRTWKSSFLNSYNLDILFWKKYKFKMQIFNLVGTIRVWNDLQIVHVVSKSRLVSQMNIRSPRVIKPKDLSMIARID